MVLLRDTNKNRTILQPNTHTHTEAPREKEKPLSRFDKLQNPLKIKKRHGRLPNINIEMKRHISNLISPKCSKAELELIERNFTK